MAQSSADRPLQSASGVQGGGAGASGADSLTSGKEEEEPGVDGGAAGGPSSPGARAGHVPKRELQLGYRAGGLRLGRRVWEEGESEGWEVLRARGPSPLPRCPWRLPRARGLGLGSLVAQPSCFQDPPHRGAIEGLQGAWPTHTYLFGALAATYVNSPWPSF